MATKDRITLALALAVAALAIIGSAATWIVIPIILLAAFLFFWARQPTKTENFIRRMPYGDYLRKALHEFDLILSPRDLDQEQHFRNVIAAYHPLMRQNLRRLIITDNYQSVLPGEWQQFFNDRLVDHPHSGPGGVRLEMRELLKRLLVEFSD